MTTPSERLTVRCQMREDYNDVLKKMTSSGPRAKAMMTFSCIMLTTSHYARVSNQTCHIF